MTTVADDLKDIFDLTMIHELARKYTAVEVTFADCGCHTVTLFAGTEKIIEEDKSLLEAVTNAAKRAEKVVEL